MRGPRTLSFLSSPAEVESSRTCPPLAPRFSRGSASSGLEADDGDGVVGEGVVPRGADLADDEVLGDGAGRLVHGVGVVGLADQDLAALHLVLKRMTVMELSGKVWFH